MKHLPAIGHNTEYGGKTGEAKKKRKGLNPAFTLVFVSMLSGKDLRGLKANTNGISPQKGQIEELIMPATDLNKRTIVGPIHKSLLKPKDNTQNPVKEPFKTVKNDPQGHKPIEKFVLEGSKRVEDNLLKRETEKPKQSSLGLSWKEALSLPKKTDPLHKEQSLDPASAQIERHVSPKIERISFVPSQPTGQTVRSRSDNHIPEETKDTKANNSLRSIVSDLPLHSHKVDSPPKVDSVQEISLASPEIADIQDGHTLHFFKLDDKKVSLELKDKDLGKITLNLEVHHRDVKAEFLLESLRTLHRIEGSITDLAINLSKEGLNLEQFSLALDHRQKDQKRTDRQDSMPVQPIHRTKDEKGLEYISRSGLLSIKA